MYNNIDEVGELLSRVAAVDRKINQFNLHNYQICTDDRINKQGKREQRLKQYNLVAKA